MHNVFVSKKQVFSLIFCQTYSTVDDGLLTPNSTVDNITREFAAALGDVSAKKEEKSSKLDKQVTE